MILDKSRRRDPTQSPTKRRPGAATLIEEFNSTEALIDYATRNWREKLVTTDVSNKEDYDALSKRPFFLFISVDAPLLTRWIRYKQRCQDLDELIPTLEDFVTMSDSDFYGPATSDPVERSGTTMLGQGSIFYKANLRIMNVESDIEAFYSHLEDLDIVNPDRIRPSWDAYFMYLASLASLRSNCMKRRVGCVLVRNKRVISTGYNGTPRGLKNCNAGGCGRCNSASAGGVGLGTCLCLHAEENALLESGRDRVGAEAILYCNTCPCLTCSVKIAQVGVKEVVYNQAYSMDDRSAEILKEAGVLLRQFSPPYED